MNPNLYHKIAASTAHRQSREGNAALILDDAQLLHDLLEIAYDVSDKHHHKACWTLELVFEEKIDWLRPHLEDFCVRLPEWKSDGAVRSAAKICMMAAQRHAKAQKTGEDFLTAKNVTAIAEQCFDWLIGDDKVAPKAYAMRALFELGKSESWIYPDLKVIISEDSGKHSAAYKGAAKDILKKLR